MNLIFIFCLSGFCFSSCQKAAEKQVYIDYCYQLNQSLLHCAQGDKEAATENLWEAQKLFDQQTSIPQPYWLNIALLNSFASPQDEALLAFAREVKIRPSEKEKYLQKLKKDRVEVMANFQEVAEEVYFVKNYEALEKTIDTLMAVDQALRGNVSDEDAALLNDQLWALANDTDLGHRYLRDKVLEIHQSYGYVGSFSCANCGLLVAPYLHLADSHYFEDIAAYLHQALLKGYLDANTYALTIDRATYRERGKDEFYYYFNFYENIATEEKPNFKTLAKLSEAEQAEVNERRRSIGIPDLPFVFINFVKIMDCYKE
ncbi:MAG: hypothetical protein R2798_02390 [Chitinophagales bacterium]|nr:hypothetical protein [Chitinophagales bacterium]